MTTSTLTLTFDGPSAHHLFRLATDINLPVEQIADFLLWWGIHHYFMTGLVPGRGRLVDSKKDRAAIRAWHDDVERRRQDRDLP